MADPPPGLALDGVIRLPEPFAYLLPPTQPLVDDGAATPYPRHVPASVLSRRVGRKYFGYFELEN